MEERAVACHDPTAENFLAHREIPGLQSGHRLDPCKQDDLKLMEMWNLSSLEEPTRS